MKRIKEDIYDRFRCTAGQCPMTCCAQWRISVDRETAAKWRKEDARLSEALTGETETEIRLDHEKKCPLLRTDRLCGAVCRYGEEMLSVTCHIFPRLKNAFTDRTEYALTAGCPEVVELLQQTGPLRFPETDDEPASGTDGRPAVRASQADLLRLRSILIRLVQEPSVSLQEAWMIGFYLLLDAADFLAKGPLLETFGHAAKQKQICQAIRKMTFHTADTLQECNELWMDLTVNYLQQGYYLDYLQPLQQTAEQLTAGAVQSEAFRRFLQTDFKQQEPLLRKVFAAELFSGLLREDSTIEDCLIHYEWMTLEYVTIRQAWFLQISGQTQESAASGSAARTSGSALPGALRDSICITMRMTGYNDDDILEYLENSFEDPVWDWGYLAMLVGLNV